MNYQITEKFIPPGQGLRVDKENMILTPNGVCWHYTGNYAATADAEAHWEYWHKTIYGAHYCIDDKSILWVAPHNEVIWHAGPSNEFTPYIINKYPNSGPNLNLIGVELCVNEGSKWSEVYKRAIYLGALLCRQNGWNPLYNFERHFDCTKKNCPAMWTPYIKSGEEGWKKFLYDIIIWNNMLDMGIYSMLEGWQGDMGVNAINQLVDNELLSKPEYWKGKITEKTPNWLFFEMINRINQRIDKIQQNSKK